MGETTGRIEAFGYDATTADVRVIPRATSWRMTRALLSLVVGLGAAPLVFFVPPHVPWVLASVGLGGFFARRFALERRTLVSLQGTCPKCGKPVTVDKPVALRDPHELTCPHCLHGLMLRVPETDPA